MAEKYITLHHFDSTVKTIEDFALKNRIFQNVEDFFDDNRKLILSQMSGNDKIKFNEKFGKFPDKPSDLVIDMVLPIPCNLRILSTKISRETTIIQTNSQIPIDDFYVFSAEQTAAVLQNEGYRVGGMIKRCTFAQKIF